MHSKCIFRDLECFLMQKTSERRKIIFQANIEKLWRFAEDDYIVLVLECTQSAFFKVLECTQSAFLWS